MPRNADRSGRARTFYWTLHAIFVKRRDQREVFDQAFHVFWKKPKMLEQLMQMFFHQVARDVGEKAKQAGFRRLAEAMFDKHEGKSQQRQKKDDLEIDCELHRLGRRGAAPEGLRADDRGRTGPGTAGHCPAAPPPQRDHDAAL